MIDAPEVPSPQVSGYYNPTDWVNRPPYFSGGITPTEALATQDGYDALVRGLQERLEVAAGPARTDGSELATSRTARFMPPGSGFYRSDDVHLYESSGAHRFTNALNGTKTGFALPREDTMTITERETESGLVLSVVFGSTFVDDRGSDKRIMARVMESPRLRLELAVGGSPRDAQITEVLPKYERTRQGISRQDLEGFTAAPAAQSRTYLSPEDTFTARAAKMGRTARAIARLLKLQSQHEMPGSFAVVTPRNRQRQSVS